MSRFKEEELIKALKETGATKVYPARKRQYHNSLMQEKEL